MSLADKLIQRAWSEAIGPSVRLYPDEVPESAQASYPNAGYEFTAYTDQEAFLSDSMIETEKYVVSIAHNDRRKIRSLAKKLKTSVEALEDENLSEATASIADFALVRGRAGAPRWYELTVEITLSLHNQEV